MARRPVAWVAAIVMLAEALGIVLVNWLLGTVVDRQDMSLAGLDPRAMSVGAWVAGGVFGIYLAVCAFVLARAAATDRSPGTFGRILLISAAVVHGLLGAFSVGLLGWPAFVLMMVVLALIVLTLVAYDRRDHAGPAGDGKGAAAPPVPPASSPEPTTP
ncbi:hypothetical protein OKJ48_28345 [Streptomyces kunmingensis]|uniref:Integral membrane protein n=1 Tax=Streptomyces kunmingensis TaxID=68225 RepID=A0ABU6CHC7_9ACTN|nr:hypothetical protein [Streptomyces kunmingensis]MEB3964120.1 hypothetical protein [Streptomyces kunmingensis]